MTYTETLLQSEITRCCDLVGHHPESAAIESALMRAYSAIRDEDHFARVVALDELKMFNGMEG